jgi:hypothetical protein
MRSLALALCCLCASTMFASEDPRVDELAKYGIKPTAKSIEAYLRSLVEENQNFVELIKQLGDASFRKREEATQRLLRAFDIDRGLLEKAAEFGDPEVRSRATLILKELRKLPIGKRRDDPLGLVLSVVAERRIKNLIQPLLAVIVRASDPVIRQRAVDAMKATAKPDDMNDLRAALADKSPTLRVAALTVLENFLGEKIISDAATLLDDADETVRLTAALMLANRGDRRALPVFATLLGSETRRVRFRAAHILRQLSGQKFDFVAHADEKVRAVAAKKWFAWIDRDSATAKLTFPIRGFAVDPRGLVLHFSFNQADRPVADQSGHENHGKLHNALYVDAGRTGGGCHLDGRGDYVNVANSDTLEIRDTLTLAVWIKLESFARAGYGDEEGHIIKKGDPLWWNPTFGLGYHKTSRRAKFVIGHPKRSSKGGGANLYSTKALDTGRWRHLAGTYNGTTARLYVDGRLEIERKYTGIIRGDRAPVMLGGGRLGSKSGFANHFVVNATLDELRIYNRALTPDEVAVLAGD